MGAELILVPAGMLDYNNHQETGNTAPLILCLIGVSMKKKKNSYPKPILKKFAQEITAMIDMNQGRLFLLERLEDMPDEVRTEMIEGMSSFYQDEMVDFFYLMKMEYDTEFAAICDKALEKYRMAGLDVTPPQFFAGTFYKAYVSRTRHTGRITLDAAWITDNSALHVECFYLTFNPDGIHSFILVDDMPIYAYEEQRNSLSDMEEVSYEEACTLIYQAYSNNLRYMTAPALGRFLYQKYIDYYIFHDLPDHLSLFRRISVQFTPRQLVNNYFLSIRNRDYLYLEALATEEGNVHRILENLGSLFSAGTLLLEAQVQDVHAVGNQVFINANAYTERDEEIFANQLQFQLTRDEQKTWYIYDFELLKQECLNRERDASPFTGPVLCRIYYVTDVDELFEILEKVDNIQSIEELTYGVHMRITEEAEDKSQGVVFFEGVAVDIVVNNGEELALISKHTEFIDELHQMFMEEYSNIVTPLGTYETDMLTAYKYINGRYKSFEDTFYDHAAGNAFDDGMRCLTVSYYVKDRAKIIESLNKVQDMAVDISPDKKVYYQFSHPLAGLGFFAEYMLDDDWLNISAFGEIDLDLARKDFEMLAGDQLEYDGVEKRYGSIFDILSTSIKKEYPGLEKALKEVYLNKWYYSGLRHLKGMSPSEASQTEEGKQLLWSMLKKFRQKEKNISRQRLSLQEYVRKLEQKKHEKQS